METARQSSERPFLQIPRRFNIAEYVVDRHVAEGRGQRAAAVTSQGRYTYDDLRRLTNRFANVLRGLGVGRGDCVLLRLGSTLEGAVAILGTLKLGAVAIPTTPLFRERELESVFNNSEAVAAVATRELAGPIEGVRSRAPSLRHVVVAGGQGESSWESLMGRAAETFTVEATDCGDLAIILYTSGTTGTPKGVDWPHRWLIGTGDPVVRAMALLTPEDVCYQPQDWSFSFPIGCGFLYPLMAGAAIVIPEGRFNPESALATLERHRVTVFAAVPTIYRMLLAVPNGERRFTLDSLRIGLSAGEPLPAPTFKEWRERFGLTILDGLGQTECHIFVANRLGMEIKPGSMGKPLPGYDVAVLDDDGQVQRTGEPGHVVIRQGHPGLTLGYHREPARWAAVNRNGWYYTKDMAYIDGDGYYWYVARSDDLIKSRAYLISPKEVESALLEHRAVLEAGVVGVPDERMGRKVKAFVTLRAGFEPSPGLAEELQRHTGGLIAPYKVPQLVEFVAELPKTLTGKILRRELRSKS